MRLSRAHSTGPDDKGTYTLVLYLRGSKRIRIGSLGWLNFPGGYYLYTGSAMHGLRARVGRHLNRAKPLHWHIDYLVPHARIMRVLMYLSDRNAECDVVQRIARLPGADFPVKGFGSSDCSRGCESHLVHFSYHPSRN